MSLSVDFAITPLLALSRTAVMNAWSDPFRHFRFSDMNVIDVRGDLFLDISRR